MLIPFVIDSDSLAPDPGWNSLRQREIYDNFIETWMQAGLLAVDGNKIDDSILFKSIASVPEKYRKRMQGLMMKCPVIYIPKWKGVVDFYDLGAIAPNAQIALVDDVRAEVEFGLTAEDYEIRNNETQVTVCRFQAFSHSTTVQDFKNIKDTHIEPGDTFKEIWDKRFRNLAIAPIKQISIVDRYAVNRHFKNLDNPKSYFSGLESFLKLLNDTASGDRYVTLYSEQTDYLNDNNITKDKIEDELSVLQKKYSHRVRLLKLYMAPDYIFAKYAHDRFIRFHANDCHQYVWDLGKGIEIFEGTSFWATSSAHFLAGDLKNYKNKEYVIQNNKETKIFKCNAQ